jgi:hypothetical protein
MKIKLSILTIMAVCATVPACADPYTVKVNPPICETTVVSRVYHAGPPGDGFTGNSRCGACASGIAYANGKGQSANIHTSRPWSAPALAIGCVSVL